MRLNRFLAAAGLGSRRGCEEIVRAGRVMINGHRCVELATEVNPGDRVQVDSRPVTVQETVHILLNKPPGIVTTAHDERGRQTVFDLLPTDLPRLFHVGRLDLESEGLLLLTNDGDLAQRITHPSHEIEKEYEVVLNRVFNPADSARLLKGVFIPVDEGGPPAPVAERPREAVRRVRARAAAVLPGGLRTVRVILHQGYKRQLRLMFYAVGYEVEKLRRIRFGPIEIGKLRLGAWRPLQPREIAELKRAVAGSGVGRTKSPAPPASKAVRHQSGNSPR